MLKWLLLIFIIPSLLFGKLYSVEPKASSSHEHLETYCGVENSESRNHYLHVHEHDHESGISSHAHSHVHFTKTFNPTDSFFFSVEEDDCSSALNDYIITSVDVFIPSNIIQDLFRPPIA
jgi:hypothetical protein